MLSASTWQDVADRSMAIGARRSLLGTGGQPSGIKGLESLWAATVGADKGESYRKGVTVVRYGMD